MEWSSLPKVELGKDMEGRILALPVSKDKGIIRKLWGTAPLEDDFFEKNKARIIESEHKIIVAVGVKDDSKQEARKFGAIAYRFIERALGPVKFHLIPDFLPEYEVIEGALLASYSFDKYKSRKDPKPWIVFHGSREAVEKAKVVAKAVFIARDIGNEPPNEHYPEKFAKMVLDLFADMPVNVFVGDENWIQEQGLNGVWYVGKGSVNKPRFVVIEYLPVENQKPVLLVGKGVAFDAGGVHLKPRGYLEDMKMDIMGGAVVVASLWALAKLGIKRNVVGIVPCVENMPDGGAMKPGDVIRMYNGKSVEIFDTDAEGRLILADALAWGERKYDPEFVVDFATLTGACIVALGRDIAGLFSTSDELAGKIEKAAVETGEEVWRLPLHSSIAKLLETPVADVRNVSDDYAGGAIQGAIFLSNFVTKPWAHLDIAGTGMSKKDKLLSRKGATGFGVRLAVKLITME